MMKMTTAQHLYPLSHAVFSSGDPHNSQKLHLFGKKFLNAKWKCNMQQNGLTNGCGERPIQISGPADIYHSRGTTPEMQHLKNSETNILDFCAIWGKQPSLQSPFSVWHVKQQMFMTHSKNTKHYINYVKHRQQENIMNSFKTENSSVCQPQLTVALIRTWRAEIQWIKHGKNPESTCTSSLQTPSSALHIILL